MPENDRERILWLKGTQVKMLKFILPYSALVGLRKISHFLK